MAKTSWHIPQKTWPGQQGVQNDEKSHPRQLQTGTCTTGVPSPKCSRGGHTKFQESLTKHPGRSSRRLPAESMGSTPTTNRNHPKPSPSVKRHTNILRICTPHRTIQLQQNATITNGVRSPSPQKIRLPGHMVGNSLRQRTVPGNVTRTLPNTHIDAW